jgi:hypothetical protein
MNPVWVVLGIAVIIYVIYYLISYLLLPKPINRVGAEEIDISQMQQVISSEELKNTWNATSGSTLAFNIFPEILDRTSVSGNEYATVIQIGSKQLFKLMVAPDAGRGYSTAPAILDVYVKGKADPETIEIPNVPLQRWTSVVIVKVGRKFNIYINGKISVSHMCTAMPDFDETQPLRVGTPRLTGTIALMSLASYPMKTNEVRELVNGMSAPDGKPYLSSGISIIPIPTINISGIPFIGCPGGNCSSPKKPGPMEEWSTPYA